MMCSTLSTLVNAAVLTTALAMAAECSADPASRRARGQATLAAITGDEGRAVIESLKDISPELGDWILDFAYGDVFSGTALALCTRELATVAVLTALGNAQPQLKVHIEGALNVGCKPQEIVAIIVQQAVYSGFPSALNGISAAREVFVKRGISLAALAQANDGA
jgi:4-carboxymuconolactone decarboxylase